MNTLAVLGGMVLLYVCFVGAFNIYLKQKKYRDRENEDDKAE